MVKLTINKEALERKLADMYLNKAANILLAKHPHLAEEIKTSLENLKGKETPKSLEEAVALFVVDAYIPDLKN